MEDVYQGLLLTAGQYDMLVVDKPEKSVKPRPESAIVDALRGVFFYEGDRPLHIVGRKLYNRVGVALTLQGLDALCQLPGWRNAMSEYRVGSLTQETRIEQAACACDPTERPMVDIALELGRRQALLQEADCVLVQFLQEVHTTHPAMRAQIKAAAECVFKAAFRVDVACAAENVTRAIAIARKDTSRLARIRAQYRTPRETGQWLTQILVKL